MKPTFIHSIVASLLLATLAATASCTCKDNIPFEARRDTHTALCCWNDNGDTQKALFLTSGVLVHNPEFFDARVLQARLLNAQGRNDEALEDIQYAVQHYHRFSTTTRATAYTVMANIYADLEDYDSALKALRRALAWTKYENRQQITEYQLNLAKHYKIMGEPDKAKHIYQKVILQNQANCQAMLGMADISYDAKDYEQSIMWINRAIEVDNTMPAAYLSRMRVCHALDDNHESALSALAYYYYVKNPDDSDIDCIMPYLVTCAGTSKEYINDMIQEADDDIRWDMLLISFQTETGDYLPVIEYYRQCEQAIGQNSVFSSKKALCYSGMGHFGKAIEEMNLAIELAPTVEERSYYTAQRAQILRQDARYEEAIADYTVYCDQFPDLGYGEYGIAFCYEQLGDLEKALEYYNRSIEIDPDYAWAHCGCADVLTELGQTDAATKDYLRVLDLDFMPDNNSCRQYALLGIGATDDAIEWMDRLVKLYPYDCGVYYDYACLFAKMGRTGQAMEKLRKALELGYCHFGHMEYDNDMAPLRELPGYQALIKEYRSKINPLPESSTRYSI